MKRRRWGKFLAWGGGVAGAGMVLLFGWLIWQVDRAQWGTLDTADEVAGEAAGELVGAPVDAIVVLGASVRADGTPGPDLRSRTWWAVSLYHDLAEQGPAPLFITTGGTPEDMRAASTVAAQMAQRRGVPAAHIVQAQGGQTTAGDMRFAAQAMQEHGLDRAVLVSHPLHLYRSRWHFQRISQLAVETYPAGGLGYLSFRQRLGLDAREAAGVMWASVNGWKYMAGLGRWLERMVYG